MISNPFRSRFGVVVGADPPHCVRCGQPIERKRKTAIYCSGSCRERASNRRAAERKLKRSPQPKIGYSDEAGKSGAADVS
jgi:predicted nucleic acid-binding Zn ribbon protein